MRFIRASLLARIKSSLLLKILRLGGALINGGRILAGFRSGLLGFHGANLFEDAIYSVFLQFADQKTGQRSV